MKRMLILLIVVATAGVSRAKVDLTTLPLRDTVQLTIYNSADLTLVRESRALTLKDGKNKLQFSWADTLIDPTSLEMFPKANADKIDITDLTYPPRVRNLGLWNIDSAVSGKVPVEISYLTSGLSWRAFYMGTLTEDEQMMSLKAYVRVTNRSGEDYEDAQTRLIVGEVHILDEIADLARRRYPHGRPEQVPTVKLSSSDIAGGASVQWESASVEAEAMEEAKEIMKEAISEYVLYTIEGTETIPTGWSKRLLSFDADDIPVVNLYKYEEERYGKSVVRFLSFKNDKDHELGETPIPGGMLKVYRTIDPNEHLAYVGQSNFKYIPIGEDVELNLGSVADVVVKPTLVDFKTQNYTFDPNGNITGWDELRTFRIEAKNTRETPAKVEILRNIKATDWDLTSRHEFEKVDVDTVKFTLMLEPRSAEEFEYVLTIHHELDFQILGWGHLVGWWKLDESSGTTAADSSGRGHDGYVDGPDESAGWDPDGGCCGGCLVFADDTAVILATNVLTDIDGEITVSVWLKDSFREDWDNWIFDTGDGDFRMQAAVGTKDESVLWRAGNDGDDVLMWNLDGRRVSRLKGWHHWAFVKDENAGRICIYFDGSLANSKAVVDNTLANVRNTPFKIGALTNRNSDYVGKMDDFRIYDCALSAGKIRQLYQNALRVRQK